MPKDESVSLEGVEQADAFLVLIGLLDDEGFRSLVSKHGLSLSGLKTDLQRSLFMAVVLRRRRRGPSRSRAAWLPRLGGHG